MMRKSISLVMERKKLIYNKVFTCDGNGKLKDHALPPVFALSCTCDCMNRITEISRSGERTNSPI